MKRSSCSELEQRFPRGTLVRPRKGVYKGWTGQVCGYQASYVIVYFTKGMKSEYKPDNLELVEN